MIAKSALTPMNRHDIFDRVSSISAKTSENALLHQLLMLVQRARVLVSQSEEDGGDAHDDRDIAKSLTVMVANLKRCLETALEAEKLLKPEKDEVVNPPVAQPRPRRRVPR